MSARDDAGTFGNLIDLANALLGGQVLACTDDFFAACENMLKDEPPTFDPNLYYDRGKVMDGWESRRKRGPGHDWAIVKLGVRGIVQATDINTQFFTGNNAPFATIEAADAPATATADWLIDHANWRVIRGQVPLRPGSHNIFAAGDGLPCTHLRLSIFPDGGVARFRVYGEALPSLTERVDLASALEGGKALACSDMYFGVMQHLTMPHKAPDMRGGWETKRRRGEGHDWVILELGSRGVLDEIVIDTNHFKGNFPDRCTLSGIDWPDAQPFSLTRADAWKPMIVDAPLSADTAHSFTDLLWHGPVTHVRLQIFPCGGVSRLRAFGRREQATADTLTSAINQLDSAAAIEAFKRCCGSVRWAEQMEAARPFLHFGSLLSTADRLWWTLSSRHWLEAFGHHPRIGEDPERLRRRFAETSNWANNEQSGVRGASEETLAALTQGNLDYEAKFGHVFLICATGKSADEMLAALRRRIQNTPERELREAASEQAKITHLRLQKLELL
jgi:allantoicase